MTKKHIELPNDGDNDETLSQELTLGEQLKSARENKGLSVDEVAEQLNLRPMVVRNIEADDFSGLGGSTYTRGYVKNFARIVQADSHRIQSCLDTCLANEQLPGMQSFSRQTTRQARDGRLTLLTYLIIVILLALMVWWWVQKSSMETELDISQPTAEEMAQGQQAINLSTINAEKSNVKAVNKDLMTLDNPSQDSSDSALETQPVQSHGANTTQSNTQIDKEINTDSHNTPMTSSRSSLLFTLTGDCWIKVTDATGRVLTSGLEKANETLSLSGEAPFSVLLGAPQSVTVSLNGNNINLESFPSGKVARLTLPLGE
ncbi:RodZ domain-containing protein [uncultured Shewanella sp.]|uniref:RodZ domain-containing protein n=1 Tax=uncultured Shewanella sp. TaxID=173975 RepID=UPI002610B165|nr:RodZ domain-containing protein [uncultured Shewanella sp.]